MLRILPSLLALSTAMVLAAPAIAADVGGGWGDDGGDQLRSGYTQEPKDWAGLGDPNDPLKFEFGMRYWYSMGSVNGSSSGSSISSTDTSHIGELYLRIDDGLTNTYAKAIAGLSVYSTGSFSSGGGSGSITEGHVGYLGADFGWNTFGDNKGSGAGLLVGYQYWREGLNTGRNNFTTLKAGDTVSYDTTTGQTFIPGDSAANSLDVNMLRLGVSAKANVGNFIDVSGELVGVPYAKVTGTLGVDDPTFSTAEYSGSAQFPYGTQNGNISSMRASATSLDGWGYGAMAEAWLGIHPTQNLTFRVGGRAWYLQGVADETYTRDFITDPHKSDPAGNYDQDPVVTSNGVISQNNPFSMFRYGVLAEADYNF